VRIALAVNPTSGQGRGLRAGEVAAARFRAAGVEVEELAGKDVDDLRGQVRTAIKGGVDALVVVGGDGMVHLGVTEVAGTPTPLGIIAAGTGNDVARALGLPIRRPGQAAEVALRGLIGETTDQRGDGGPPAADPARHRRRIDAVRCTTPDRPDQPVHWFASVLGAGFDALVNERANGWSRPRGRAKYVLAVLRELPLFTPRMYTIDLDGEPWTTRAMLVAVANGPSYGGGMRVCPDARMDDGRLDVMVVRPLSRARFLTIFPRVFSGTHVRDPRVVIRRGVRVVVHTHPTRPIVGYADGERVAALPLTCECVPGAVEMLAPRAAATPAE
jgi:diacylglycerol kinase (ATP)